MSADGQEEIKSLGFKAVDGGFEIRGLPRGTFQLVLELPNHEKYNAALELAHSERVFLWLDTKSGELRIAKMGVAPTQDSCLRQI